MYVISNFAPAICRVLLAALRIIASIELCNDYGIFVNLCSCVSCKYDTCRMLSYFFAMRDFGAESCSHSPGRHDECNRISHSINARIDNMRQRNQVVVARTIIHMHLRQFRPHCDACPARARDFAQKLDLTNNVRGVRPFHNHNVVNMTGNERRRLARDCREDVILCPKRCLHCLCEFCGGLVFPHQTYARGVWEVFLQS